MNACVHVKLSIQDVARSYGESLELPSPYTEAVSTSFTPPSNDFWKAASAVFSLSSLSYPPYPHVFLHENNNQKEITIVDPSTKIIDFMNRLQSQEMIWYDFSVLFEGMNIPYKILP
jgi:hypothetical protein